jgi:hypothetical protein
MALNTHTNTTPNSSSRGNGVSANLKPTESELGKLSGLQTAIDTLICQNNFMDNNPMRMNGDDILIWDWVILTVNGFPIPTPIHPASKRESFLFTANGREVVLSHHQCAVTTAYFYFSTLLDLSESWDKVTKRLNPFFVFLLSGGITEVKSLGKKEALKILQTLHDNLCAKGFDVLN